LFGLPAQLLRVLTIDLPARGLIADAFYLIGEALGALPTGAAGLLRPLRVV